ncbi:hypothetical protein L6303_06275 [archaeon]|nr:hypothetical protein [Nanoarchaeota archaeon]MBU4300018.1 hypothetical protein [Nanoarchaeota archaeon]MCG2724323.1 hypothetical protein [archaeon]
MDRIHLGILLGAIAGIIDVIPMLLQNLTWDANLSAFSFWIAAGFFIAVSDIKLKGALKGVAVSLVLLIPLAFIIGWKEPASLIPVLIMNLILGSSLGMLIDKFSK